MRFGANRRQFLTSSLAAAAAVACPTVVRAGVAPEPAPGPAQERALAFHNLHTGESLRTVYWAEGAYVPDGLRAIDAVLRDHRTGEVAAIDPKLMDLLFALRRDLDTDAAYHIVSGYRSPRTNALLRKASGGVAKRSLHMQGKAIDVSLPGRDLKDVRRAARALKAGGVGYYAKPGFVHLDTGRVRFW